MEARSMKSGEPHDSSTRERAPQGAWSLRAARGDDFDRIHDLLTQVRLPTAGIEDQFGDGYVVADASGSIVGSAGVEVYERYGLLRGVAVLPKWQGAGIGNSLVLDRLYWAKSSGLITVFLLTTSPRFFERMGFRHVDRNSVPAVVRFSKEFSSICPDTAAVLAMPVNGAFVERRDEVRSRYAQIARFVEDRDAKPSSSCCGAPAESRRDAPAEAEAGGCCGGGREQAVKSIITSDLYSDEQIGAIPDKAAFASLGCGNPTALAELREGEVVLDLGSGGGIDVLLSARRVGPTGKAYGLDMTDEMVELARRNQREAGVTNVEFLKGEIEAIPLPDNTVDVVISNCVINLSTDKRQVLAEAFRVLRPGGRFAVSDIVARGDVPDAIKRDAELWTGCIAGSLGEQEYAAILREVGFDDVDVEPTRIYQGEDLCADISRAGVDPAEVDGKFMSAFVRATKPRER